MEQLILGSLSTLPYLTTEKASSGIFFKLFAAINNLSEHNFVAPYKLTGAAALSVLKATTFLTFWFKHASITF